MLERKITDFPNFFTNMDEYRPFARQKSQINLRFLDRFIINL
jgi:hypothetical protein